MNRNQHLYNRVAVLVTVLSLCLCLSVAIAHCANRLSVASYFETKGIRLIVKVEPNKDNRRLVIAWDIEDGPAGEEGVQLDGLQADGIIERHYPYAPGMHYYFVVSLHDARGKSFVQTLEVGAQ